MQHCTPEQLALAALREPLPAADTAHVAACDACRTEIAALRRAPDLLSVPQLSTAGPAVAPPPRVWDAIAAATAVTAVPAGTAPAFSAVPEPVAPDVRVPDEPAGGTVVPLRSRRRPLLLAAAAVVAGAVVGAGAVAVVQRSGSDDGEAVTTVALAPLPDADASGSADVVVRADGSRVLELELEAPELDDAYYEVWIIDRSVEGMFPLGVVTPGRQTVELPAGVDLAEFPLLDVSVEPLDGDPTHSGVSVARGDLDA
ncbi:anti-sigma factor [Blastococcus sp. SYSU D01042]